MADTVTTRVLANTPRQHIVLLTGLSDGTGESAVAKVDKSTLLAADGAEPASLDIEFIEYHIVGYTRIQLLWDHTTDDSAILLPAGYAKLDFTCRGQIRDFERAAGILDPRSTGATGDILLTTTGHDSGDMYSIILGLRKAVE